MSQDVRMEIRDLKRLVTDLGAKVTTLQQQVDIQALWIAKAVNGEFPKNDSLGIPFDSKKTREQLSAFNQRRSV